MKIRIFTDGACSGNPGPGGWGIVWNTDNNCEQFSGHEVKTTNNRMELLAVVRSLEKIVKDGKRKNTYEIYSDSAYVVNSINNNWLVGWKLNGWKTKQKEDVKNKDLWEQADVLLQAIRDGKLSVQLIKIKGHSGNTFNELVDELAKKESAVASAIANKLRK